MLTDTQRAHVAAVTRTLQIIVGALACGVLMFGGIVLLLNTPKAAPDHGAPGMPLLTYAAAGVAIVSLVISWVLPGVLASSQRQSLATGSAPLAVAATTQQPSLGELGNVGPLTAMLQTRVIVGAAILEGAALLNLCAFMIEHQVLSLVMAGVLVISLLGRIPTTARMKERIENDLAAVEQLRQLGTRDG